MPVLKPWKTPKLLVVRQGGTPPSVSVLLFELLRCLFDDPPAPVLQILQVGGQWFHGQSRRSQSGAPEGLELAR